MKKLFYSIMAVAAASLMTLSCNSILETESPSSFDDKTVYSNYTLAEETIFAIHQKFSEQNSYRGRFLPWYGFNTDTEWYLASKPGDAKTQLVAYDTQTNDSQMNATKNPYSDMYSAIEVANLTIAGLGEYGNVENDPDMAFLLAEAKTLRAMLYYDLIKAWGDVPARFEPITSSTLYEPKSSRDVIFERILSDLEEAIPALPWPGQGVAASTDRVNRIFAEGLYARIALAASGYALRPADGAVGTGDLGSVRLSSDGNLSKDVLYPKALSYLQDAIASGKASLYSSYEQLWRDFNNMENMKAGGEVLFSIPFGPATNDLSGNRRGRWNYTFAIRADYSPINGKGGTAGPTPNLWFKFDPQDSRRDITCANFSWDKNGSPAPSGITSWYFGKYRFDWMTVLPYNGGNDDGIKPIVMRYSDILLMAAEIENELNGPTSTAKNYLKQVRERAFASNPDMADTYVDALSGKEEFFNAIVDERALEFCGEFLRKGDLIRWNMLGSKMKEAQADLTALSTLSGDYSELSGNIWWKENDDASGIIVWGLGKGETSAPEGSDWIMESQYVDKASTWTKDDKIGCLFFNDPDTRQFWPIFDYLVTNSQGTLVNDYGYVNN